MSWIDGLSPGQLRELKDTGRLGARRFEGPEAEIFWTPHKSNHKTWKNRKGETRCEFLSCEMNRVDSEG